MHLFSEPMAVVIYVVIVVILLWPFIVKLVHHTRCVNTFKEA